MRALPLLLMLVLVCVSPARAQEGYPLPDNLAVITTANAAQMVQLAEISNHDLSPFNWVSIIPSIEIGIFHNLSDTRFVSLRTGEERQWAPRYPWMGLGSQSGSIIMAVVPLPDAPASTVNVWRVDTLEQPQILANTMTYGLGSALSSDGRLFAVINCSQPCTEANQILLWDIQENAEIAQWIVGEQTIYALAFSPDGTLLVTGSGEGISFWDFASALEQNSETLTEVAHINYPAGRLFIYSINFSPNGETLLISGSFDTENFSYLADVSDLLNSDDPLAITADEIFAISAASYFGFFSPDSTLVVTKDHPRSIERIVNGNIIGGSQLRLWDVESQTQAIYMPAEDGVFSPDSSVLATRRFNVVTLWDVNMLRNGIFQSLNRLENTGFLDINVNDIAFNLDGTLLFVVMKDSVQVWGIPQQP